MLENENIHLRAMEPEDLSFLYRLENDSSVWECGCTYNPISRYALKQYLQNTHSDIYEDKELRLIIELRNPHLPIGCIDLYDFDLHNQKAAVAILIDTPYRQQQLATQSLQLLKQYAFEFLKINQLYAYIAQKNNASKALFEKCGFEHTATLKEWVKNIDEYTDVFLYQSFMM